MIHKQILNCRKHFMQTWVLTPILVRCWPTVCDAGLTSNGNRLNVSFCIAWTIAIHPVEFCRVNLFARYRRFITCPYFETKMIFVQWGRNDRVWRIIEYISIKPIIVVINDKRGKSAKCSHTYCIIICGVFLKICSALTTLNYFV